MCYGVTRVIFTWEARQKVGAWIVEISTVVWSKRHAVDGNQSYQPEKGVVKYDFRRSLTLKHLIVGDDVRRL
jgi:hypothetical protein